MVNKYFGGVIPAAGPEEEVDLDLKNSASLMLAKVEENMEALKYTVALEELWTFIRRSNKYIDQTTPWILARDEEQKERLATVLYNLVEALRIIAGTLKPFMVKTPYLMGEQLGIEDLIRETKWEDLKVWGQVKAGVKVKQGDPIFPRIDLEEYFAEVEKRKEKQAPGEKETAKGKETETVKEKDLISYDEFSKVEIRVAEVLEAEKIEGSNKLLKLQVDLGTEKRQLVAGIGQHYQGEDLIGKKILMVANLQPAKIFGVESNGMILAASNDEGKLVITTVDQDISNGSRVK